MKNIKVKLFTLTLVSIFIGCNSDFGDMNVDPNNPSEALPDLLACIDDLDLLHSLRRPASKISKNSKNSAKD